MAQAEKTKAATSYDVNPKVASMQKWVADLQEKTGRSLDEWLALLKKEGPPDARRRRDWLKSKHSLGTYSAMWITERAEGRGGDHDDPESYLKAATRYVEEQYAGRKAALRPSYERLLALGRALGTDVKACPCKTMVPLYREHVFAQLKATTNTRIDLGLCLTTYTGKVPKRIIDTGGRAKKDRITHRMEIQSLADIDGGVEKWLATAYRLDR